MKPNENKIKNNITTQISTFDCNMVKKNYLIPTCLGLPYLNVVYTYYTGHNRKTELYIGYFAIIFWSLKLLKYACKIIYMIAYFKKL